MPEMEDPKTIESPSKTVTRRKFILGVIAGGAVVSAASYKILAPGRARSFGGERLISLNVNGKQRRVEVMKQETLAWTLRYKLGLTGTKLGCDRAECGSCTVLIDDVPYYSCSVLTNTVRGKNVTTIEGLEAEDGTLHPVQQAVVDEQGFPMRVLHAGLRDVGGRISEEESEPHARGDGAGSIGQPVPLPGLHEDSGRNDARRRVHEDRGARRRWFGDWLEEEGLSDGR